MGSGYSKSVKTNQPLVNKISSQDVDKLIKIFEKPLDINSGKKLLIKALENPEIAKLCMCPDLSQIVAGGRLSKAMRRYSLSAQDLDANPLVLKNLIVVYRQAAELKNQSKLFKQGQKKTLAGDLLFGAGYNTNTAERRRQALGVVTAFSAANGTVCTFAPPVLDFAAIGLASMAMGAALADIYGAKGSGFTVTGLTDIAAGLAVHNGSDYIISKTSSWLLSHVPFMQPVAMAIEGGASAASQAAIGIATICIFESQIKRGQQPRFPQGMNALGMFATATYSAMFGIGLKNSLMMLVNGRGNQILDKVLDNGGDELIQRAIIAACEHL